MSTEPVNEAAFFTTIRSWRLVRSESRVFGGVLGGLGARIGMAAAPTRILFVLAAIITGGLALLAYAAAWALMPDHEGHIIAQDFGRGRPNVGALVMIGVLTFFGFITLGNLGVGSAWFRNGINIDSVNPGIMGGGLGHLFVVFMAIAIPLLIVGGIVAVIVWAVRSSNGTRTDASGYARLPDGTVPTAPSQPDAAAGDDADLAQASGVVAATVATDAATVTATVLTAAPAAPPTPPAPPLYYAAPAPAPAPIPRRPRVPGPGKVGYLLALALIPLSIAVTVYLYSTDQLAVFPVVVTGVIFTAGLGLVLVINALRGRKAGFLGFVSVVAVILTVIVIGAAPQLREHYASGDWATWVRDQGLGNQDGTSWTAAPSPIDTPDPFDPAATFGDYSFVAISASCFADPGVMASEGAGIVSLSAVTADQSVTVTGSQTHIIIPTGTSVEILNDSGMSMGNGVDVSWIDRDVTCSSDGSTTAVAELTNADAPVLTIRVNDTQGMGNMTLWIEEN